MPDNWEGLTNQFISVLKNAEGYLVVRVQGAKEQAEQKRIQDLLNEVNVWITDVGRVQDWYHIQGSNEILDQDPDTREKISNELQSTSRVVGQLQERLNINIPEIDRTIERLHQCVDQFYTAGPHGPGKGRPWLKKPGGGKLGK